MVKYNTNDLCLSLRINRLINQNNNELFYIKISVFWKKMSLTGQSDGPSIPQRLLLQLHHRDLGRWGDVRPALICHPHLQAVESSWCSLSDAQLTGVLAQAELPVWVHVQWGKRMRINAWLKIQLMYLWSSQFTTFKYL